MDLHILSDPVTDFWKCPCTRILYQLYNPETHQIIVWIVAEQLNEDKPQICSIKAPNPSWSPPLPFFSSLRHVFYIGIGKSSAYSNILIDLLGTGFTGAQSLQIYQRAFQVAKGNQPSAGARSSRP